MYEGIQFDREKHFDINKFFPLKYSILHNFFSFFLFQSILM